MLPKVDFTESCCKKGVDSKIDLYIAESRADIIEAKMLVSERYHDYYRIFFSHEFPDLQCNIEPYPDYYLVARCGDSIVACVSIYVNETYVERYGDLDYDVISKQLELEGMPAIGQKAYKFIEITKLVVASDFIGSGLSQLMISMAHSRSFLCHRLNLDEGAYLVLSCGKKSVFRHLHHKVGIGTRVLGQFPSYYVHRFYRSGKYQMDNRLIIPKCDIPKSIYDYVLPISVSLEDGKIKDEGLGVSL